VHATTGESHRRLPHVDRFGDCPHALDSIDATDLSLYLASMPFARVQGSMQWVCGFCGHLNQSTLHYLNSWRVQCNGSDCRRRMVVGLTFYPMTTGFKTPPADSIMPVEISREMWRSGQPLNRFVTNSELNFRADDTKNDE
jgi:hypothetical protein